MDKTLSLLQKLPNASLSIPSGIPDLINYVYSNNPQKRMSDSIKEIKAYTKSFHKPDKFRFTLYENRKEIGTSSAETRHSDLISVPVLLVNEDEFIELQDCSNDTQLLSYDKGVYYWKHRIVNVNCYRLQNFQEDMVIEKGMLAGVHVYKTNQGNFVITDDGQKMYYNEEKGFVFE